MKSDQRFLPAIPEGMQIHITGVEVAGTYYRLSDALAFAKGSNQWLLLEREPRNKHDPNAIKVIGAYKGWFMNHRKHIGYVPADIAKELCQRPDLELIVPRLRNIWCGESGSDKLIVRFDLLENKPAKPSKKTQRAR